jgi:hypothetical protein
VKKTDSGEEKIPGFEGALGKANTYSDNFFAFVYDFNHDGWDDILIIGFPGKEAIWYENPRGGEGDWKKHVVFDVVDNESPWFTDINGDNKPELVCNSRGYFGYAQPDWDHPEQPWKFHPISPKGDWGNFTHGLGVGDINGDGKADVIEKDGWWEQPASLEGDPVWKFHPFQFADPSHGSSQMFAYDVNGDGKADVIAAQGAHRYGLAWFEQTNTNGEISFKKHVILEAGKGNDIPPPDKYGVQFSELHAVDLIDMDGDGLKDIVTGKRFWSHGATGGPGSGDPAVLYWFKLTRLPGGDVEFVPHLIDNDSGVGTQVVAGHLAKTRFPDVVVGNKKGTFVFLHSAKRVTKEEYEKAQPKPIPGDAAK